MMTTSSTSSAGSARGHPSSFYNNVVTMLSMRKSWASIFFVCFWYHSLASFMFPLHTPTRVLVGNFMQRYLTDVTESKSSKAGRSMMRLWNSIIQTTMKELNWDRPLMLSNPKIDYHLDQNFQINNIAWKGSPVCPWAKEDWLLLHNLGWSKCAVGIAHLDRCLCRLLTTVVYWFLSIVLSLSIPLLDKLALVSSQDQEYQGLYSTVQEETAPPPPPKSKKGFAGIVGGLLAKKGKRAESSTSSSGTTRNEHMFPCLGMLARQVLSVPVSTVAVEREFSAGGNILTDYRSCLNAESLETLVCNQDWLLARRRAQESSYQLESEHYMNATTDGSPSSEE
ncbi:hypothetical protein DM860_002204 [Cuscuta australis]|uniref:HAT C-terminal dimerisation domain-containing protein n=1 Tax=Cuscuta australis TaxID=267555 RepID=A0A328E0I1_9ASTE|nr:hypothetical protein DM860_002204 [Cuscuta australis]